MNATQDQIEALLDSAGLDHGGGMLRMQAGDHARESDWLLVSFFQAQAGAANVYEYYSPGTEELELVRLLLWSQGWTNPLELIAYHVAIKVQEYDSY